MQIIDITDPAVPFDPLAPYVELGLDGDRRAVYSDSTSTDVNLDFRFVVGAGDRTADLDYKSADSLKMGSSTLTKGTNTYRRVALAAPGETGSLSAVRNIRLGSNAAPEFDTTTYLNSAVARSVDENATSGDLGAVITATDADPGDTLAYSAGEASVSNAADHLSDFNRDFEISADGQISVRSDAQIDYEDRPSYVVAYQVTDGKDNVGFTETNPTVDDSLTLTVTVGNVDEAGEVTITGIYQEGRTLTASVTDPDGSVASTTWQWSWSTTSTGTFTDITTNATAASYTVQTGDVGRYLRATAGYTDGHGTGKTALGTTTSPMLAAGVMVNSEPEFPDTGNDGADPVTRRIAENAPAGTALGAAVGATDADNDPLNYTVAAVSSSPTDQAHLTAFDDDFFLNPSTGQITVRRGAQIDYEDRTSYVVDVRVSDSKDSTGGANTAIDDTVRLTIDVDNVNEAGSVTISGTYEAGETLTATLADPDGDLFRGALAVVPFRHVGGTVHRHRGGAGRRLHDPGRGPGDAPEGHRRLHRQHASGHSDRSPDRAAAGDDRRPGPPSGLPAAGGRLHGHHRDRHRRRGHRGDPGTRRRSPGGAPSHAGVAGVRAHVMDQHRLRRSLQLGRRGVVLLRLGRHSDRTLRPAPHDPHPAIGVPL